MSTLVIAVNLHEGRWHGAGEPLPSPARLFQALVAGAARAGIDDVPRRAFEWLETQAAPTVCVPHVTRGQVFKIFVPDNDLDAKDGAPEAVAEIRSAKQVAPLLFDAAIPFVFAWPFDETPETLEHTRALCRIATRLYQFGRGIDMAWATGEILEGPEFGARLESYGGRVLRPGRGSGGLPLLCPAAGSLASLDERFAAGRTRLTREGAGRAATEFFRQPPKPRFREVIYSSRPTMQLFEFVDAEGAFSGRAISRSGCLVESIRDAAAERLRNALRAEASEVERFLVGRKADGADAAPTESRIRITPIPSIGHEHADRLIRRILVEVPSTCPLSAADVFWAFSGLPAPVPNSAATLVRAADDSMLRHYGVAAEPADLWRSVTPCALSEPAARRRIEPARQRDEAKNGAERVQEETRAVAAVHDALRHAGVRARPGAIRVQREPFESNGSRVEQFAEGTRFAKERLWHVEIRFRDAVSGPLVLGDGRFLGLGVMAPACSEMGVFVFEVAGGMIGRPAPVGLSRALRRAVMARVQQEIGTRKPLPSYVSGHSRGAPARSEDDPHLTFAFDPDRARLLVLAPHVVDHRTASPRERDHLDLLARALARFEILRAGDAGVLTLRRTAIDPTVDPLFRPAHRWSSVTPYQVTRHLKDVSASDALASDLRHECRRRELPTAEVRTEHAHGVSNVGLVGLAQISFATAVSGPIVLGRSRHLGGGLFVGAGNHG